MDQLVRATPRRVWSPLRIRSIRHVLPAQALSDLGDGFSYVALAWLTLDLTGSSLALGGVLAAQAIPRTVFTLVGGATSDRISPRVQMIFSSGTRAALMAIVAVLTFTHTVQLWHLYLLGALFGIVDAFFQPARASLLPSIVESDDLESSNGLLSAASRVCSIAGPAVGGVLVAASGTGWAFVVDGACFVLVAVALFGIHVDQPPAPASTDATPSLRARIVEGVRYVFADPRLRAVLAIDAAVNFSFAGPLTVGLASLVRNRFAQNASAFGALDGAIALGGLIGALIGGSVHVRPRVGLLIAALAGWLACGMALLGVAGNLGVGVIVAFAMGCGTGFQAVFGLSWVQRTIDRDVLGRVMSVDMVAGYALGPISLIVTGALAGGHLELLYIGTAALLALTAVGVLSSRTVRSMV
ncbi:MAG TPA: MFS transporter [Micromonosporaceae bacterium]|jgi:MFS family permease